MWNYHHGAPGMESQQQKLKRKFQPCNYVVLYVIVKIIFMVIRLPLGVCRNVIYNTSKVTRVCLSVSHMRSI